MNMAKLIIIATLLPSYVQAQSCDWKKLQDSTTEFVEKNITLGTQEQVKQNSVFLTYAYQVVEHKIPKDLAKKIASNMIENLRSPSFYRTSPCDMTVPREERIFPHSTYEEMKNGFNDLDEYTLFNVEFGNYVGMNYINTQANTVLDLMNPNSDRRWFSSQIDEQKFYDKNKKSIFPSSLNLKNISALNAATANILNCVPPIKSDTISKNTAIDQSSRDNQKKGPHAGVDKSELDSSSASSK